ncbi:ABC transporter substrate-binding protein [Nocardia sp. 348MFTsu5.1]|uniref:ABC transporter substrate-binding protein n=1 Tax=Nocardia sp. 348MFTsu5.1 TaxID=1172185 RepID=UPI0006887EA8|nr:ABC transporter substrate-binding protein [Nocardia sp. 348MFTsu5.1]
MRSVRRVLGALTVAVALTTAMAACSSSDDSSSSDGEVVGSVASGPDTVVRKSGDELKVVALGWSDGEISLSLGVKPIAIYDWQGLGESNKGVGSWATDLFGDYSPTVIKNTGTTYNYEQIELLEPDLILNVRAASDERVFDRLSEIAPVATAPPGTPDFAVDWRTQTKIIGEAIGKTAEADQAVADTSAKIEAAATANPDFKDKTFVYAAKFADAYGAYVAGDARFDVFAEMGFVAYPPLLALQPSGYFAAVSAEQVAALNAQVAIFTTISKPMSDLTSDNLINSLSVVKDGRAIMLDEKSEVNVALAAGTPQSIAIAVDQVVPMLQQSVAKIPA